MRRTLFLAFLAVTACDRGDNGAAPSNSRGAPAAALARSGRAATLELRLALLQREIAAARSGDDDLRIRLERAEAITDGLLETQLPFAWMTGRAYGVEPMVRQIQALADRILAQLRSGAGENAVQDDLADLDQKIALLQAGLRAGGGQMPASLDSLLARYAADTLAVALERGGE